MYHAREFVDAGGLMAYGVSYPDLYRRAAIFVDKIFPRRQACGSAGQQPTKFECVISLKTAKALGMENPTDAARPRRRGDRIADSRTADVAYWHFSAVPTAPSNVGFQG